MNFCPECGTQIVGNGKFCSNCGRALNVDTASVQSPKPATTAQIQMVSKSCKNRLENEWRMKPRLANSLVGIGATFLGLIAYGPLIFAYLRGEPEHKLKNFLPDSGVNLLILLCIIGLFIFVAILTSKLKENYLVYENYCDKEYLELNDVGISGTTAYGIVELRYEDIRSVETFSNDQATKFALIKLNTLKISERSGRAHSFYTFENAAELSNAIRRHPSYSPGKFSGQASNSTVAKPLSGGRIQCSKCGQVQMGGKTYCCACGKEFEQQ